VLLAQSDEREQLGNTASDRVCRQVHEVVERLLERVGDRHARVERSTGLLEDHLHGAAHLPQPGAPVVHERLAADLDGASADRREADDRPRDGRLAASALADEGDRLAPVDGEIDVRHGAVLARAQHARPHRVVDGQPLDPEDRAHERSFGGAKTQHRDS